MVETAWGRRPFRALCRRLGRVTILSSPLSTFISLFAVVVVAILISSPRASAAISSADHNLPADADDICSDENGASHSPNGSPEGVRRKGPRHPTAISSVAEEGGNERGRRQVGQRRPKPAAAEAAREFFSSLASSLDFSRGHWRRKPMLVRSGDKTTGGVGWAEGYFGLDDLESVDWSGYAGGQRTSDAVRDGSAADRWEGNVPIQVRRCRRLFRQSAATVSVQ